MPAYVPRDPDVYCLETALDPALAEGAIPPPALEEIHPRVFQLPLLSRAWCRRFLREVEHREAWSERRGETLTRPNSMNEYGVILDEIGFTPFLDALLQRCLAPLGARLYPDLGAAALDAHHGFVVHYEDGKDEDLGFHVDDSEMTLNLCLGDEFGGSELYFRGMRCDLHRQTGSHPEEVFEYDHVPGTALLHAGKQRHGVHSLRWGLRKNLIVWCSSSTYRAEREQRLACPDWCSPPQPGRR